MRTYSGGMRRRLDLGASLVGRPQLHLLDEPTSGLDPRSRAELWNAIRDLVADGNAQAAQGMSSLVVMPFTFVSSAYVPIDSMPGWMQAFASNQPVTAIVNAVRSLMLGGTDAAGIGHSTAHWVALSLLWCAGILVVFATIAVTRFTKRR